MDASTDGSHVVDDTSIRDVPETPDGVADASDTDTDTDTDTASCPPSMAKCEGACVDLQTDNDHCGACAAACHPNGNHTTATCTRGECERGCEAGWSDANGDWIDTSQPSSDSDGCACWAPGDAGEVCDDGLDNDCDQFIDCADDDCGPGTACSGTKVCSGPVPGSSKRTCCQPQSLGDFCEDQCGQTYQAMDENCHYTRTQECGSCNLSQCMNASDCASGYCNNGLCYALHCINAKKDGGETDRNCGGPCPPCANGKKCDHDSDCKSGTECKGGKCKND